MSKKTKSRKAESSKVKPAAGECPAKELLKAQKYIKELEFCIGAASTTLYDWDGYFCERDFTGNAPKLAALIEDTYSILQGTSWRSPKPRLWSKIHRREDAAKKTKKKGKK